MKWIMAAAYAAAILFAFAPVANAKGCIKGAVAGGAAGHMAGQSKLLGAAAGCVIGRRKANADQSKARAKAPSEQK